MSASDRRFEALVFDWDGTAVRDRTVDAAEVREVIEALCARGMHVTVVSGTQLGKVDGRLQARPKGPGRLLLAVAGGSELYEVGQNGPRLVHRRDASDATNDAARRLFGELWSEGVAPSLVLMAGDEIEPTGVPEGVVHLGGRPERFLELLHDQLRRRERGDVPDVAAEPGWSLDFEGIDHARERAVAALLTLGDGTIGTSGAPLLGSPTSRSGVLIAGLYRDEDERADLLDAPRWDRLQVEWGDGDTVRRTLDLHSGVLAETIRDHRFVRSARFSSLARPGTAVLRVDAEPAVEGRWAIVGSDDFDTIERRRDAPEIVVLHGKQRSAVTAAAQDEHGDGRFDRIAVYERVDAPDATTDATVARLAQAREDGFEALLAEHRRAWARRWDAADVRVVGDADLQVAIRVALYHLMAAVADVGEAAVGARGLSGHGYRGHVFWDTDVFVLPFFAATHPAAARAILEYRIRRLPVAMAAARAEGRRGARFPWEAATLGDDVTPRSVRDQTGTIVPIRTGDAEVHIVADVAWAAACYADWSGDDAFAATHGHRILVETARYWASRIRVETDGAHLFGVIGPDEYHEPVDDNMFTNVMARWNLRRAAASALRFGGVDGDEPVVWRELADALVDGYDGDTGVYEQFAGFNRLEPVIVAEVAPRRPIVADLLLGRERVRRAQVIKQPDVLMAQHLVPDECEPESLIPNLDFYEPRTAHGSSLSPGIHASLLARAARFDEALHWLRVAARVDLDDVTGTTAAGVHLATMGSVWQALAWGFAGLRARPDALAVDPRLPPAWGQLDVSVQFHGVPVRVRIGADETTVVAPEPVAVAFGRGNVPLTAGPDGLTLQNE